MKTNTLPSPNTVSRRPETRVRDRAVHSAPLGGSLAWISPHADIDRALTQICGLLRRRHLRPMGDRPAPLLGVWVGTGPRAGGRPRGFGSGLATSGDEGAWSVLWPDAPTPSRRPLLTQLVQAEPGEGRFFPVFASDTDSRDIDLEVAELRRAHPNTVDEVILQHPVTGWLWPRNG